MIQSDIFDSSTMDIKKLANSHICKTWQFDFEVVVDQIVDNVEEKHMESTFFFSRFGIQKS